jgi:putative membrane protein
MKGIFRTYLVHLNALWIVTEILPEAIAISGGFVTFLFAAGVLTLFNLLLKPILKLLFLPINALSLGLFSIVINTGVFYLFLQVVNEVSITPWTFASLTVSGIVIPSVAVSFVASLVVVSFSVSLMTHLLVYLVK